jgi:hypothetical protein
VLHQRSFRKHGWLIALLLALTLVYPLGNALSEQAAASPQRPSDEYPNPYPSPGDPYPNPGTGVYFPLVMSDVVVEDNTPTPTPTETPTPTPSPTPTETPSPTPTEEAYPEPYPAPGS